MYRVHETLACGSSAQGNPNLPESVDLLGGRPCACAASLTKSVVPDLVIVV